LVARASFARPLVSTALFMSAMRFTLRRFGSFRKLFGRSLGFWFALAPEGCFEVQISPEIVVGRRRCADGTRRTRRTSLGPTRFLTSGSFRRLSLGLRTRGFAGGLRSRWRRRRCRRRLVEEQVLGRNRRVCGRVRTEIDAEQVFG